MTTGMSAMLDARVYNKTSMSHGRILAINTALFATYQHLHRSPQF